MRAEERWLVHAELDEIIRSRREPKEMKEGLAKERVRQYRAKDFQGAGIIGFK